MTRGRISIVVPNGIYMSTEFNGDMYPAAKGKDVIRILESVIDEESYRTEIEKFDNDNFGYNETTGISPINFHQDSNTFDFTEDYIFNYHSDYVYIKNLSDKDVYIVDINGKIISLPVNDIKAFHFGKEEDISEYRHMMQCDTETLIHNNAKKLGLDTILFQTQEECAELIQAVSKYNRARGIGQKTEKTIDETVNNIAEEIADVSICITQLSELLHLQELIKLHKIKALKKTENRITH